MNKISYKKHLFSLFLTLSVLIILFLAGPASAVQVQVSQPNDANKGSDVSFSITIDIVDTDVLPVQYTDLIITGPNGFSKRCTVYMNGVDDCDDVDFTLSMESSLGYGYGYDGYGYDYNLGFGYDLGNDASTLYYGVGGTSGLMTADVVWHTSSSLDDGVYTATAEVYAEGTSGHTFASTEKTFSISTASAPVDTTSGYRPTIDPTIASKTITPEETTPSETRETGEAGEIIPTEEAKGPTGLAGITGAVIGAFGSPVGKGILTVFLVLVVGLLGYMLIYKRKY